MNTNHPTAASLRGTAMAVHSVGAGCTRAEQAPSAISSARFALQVADALDRGLSFAEAKRVPLNYYVPDLDPQAARLKSQLDDLSPLAYAPATASGYGTDNNGTNAARSLLGLLELESGCEGLRDGAGGRP